MRHILSAGASSAAFVVVAIGCAAPAAAQAPSPVLLEGADKDILEKIAITLPERERPETAFDAERLAEEAADRAQAWLRSEGYYAGFADPQADDDPPRARVKISLGKRFAFTRPIVKFDGGVLDAPGESAVRTALEQVKEGAPARAENVLAAEQSVLLVLQDRGYAEAKALPREAIVDHATGDMAVTFAFDIGAPVRLGQINLDPPAIVKDEFVEKLKTWKSGDLYSPDKLVDLRRDLTSTGAFSRAQVTLAPSADAEGVRDVNVHLDSAKAHTIALGGSYSTTDGIGVDAEWTKRNVYGRADSLTYSASLAELDQRASAEWFRPHAVGRGRGLRYKVEIAHENVAPYERSSVTLSAAVEAQPNVKFAASYGGSIAANTYTESAGIDNAIILSGFYDLRQDRADSKLDPRNGTVLEGRIEPAVAFGEASTAFVRTTGTARGYYSLGETDRTTLAARISAGWVQPIAGSASDLPLDRLFYAGGGGSVRGYEYRSIYPNTALLTTDPPGGQGLLETSFEARFRATNKIGGALFLDGGSAFNDFGEAGDMRWGAGAGLRYDLGFAPLRFDVAVPLDKRDGDPNVAFYVSLGQAF